MAQNTDRILSYLTGTRPTMRGILRARAVILLERAGLTMREASRRLGHHPVWASRRLDDSAQTTNGTKLDDLEHLASVGGFDCADLLAPALLPVDDLVLRHVRQQPREVDDLRALFADAEASIARLRSQWLIAPDDQGRQALTDLGRAHLFAASHLANTKTETPTNV